ncbi:unnamed protein product [Trifolium pratense]|uniref:Uncharacterized protein n=1 Tax=Trifolium pratense TaxID=57577 RepID=A0ACB0L569_TRIPR|nr:unnamed protein product [Trifolium pratense]
MNAIIFTAQLHEGVDPSYGMKEHGKPLIIECLGYSNYGRRKLGNGSVLTQRGREYIAMRGDHVFMWYYDLYNCKHIGASVFNFRVKTRSNENEGFYSIKECGIFPICYSEFPTTVSTVNLDRDLGREIALKLSEMFGSDFNELMQLNNEIESIERCDEKESTCIQKNQQDLDLNEKCSCSYECLMGPLSYLWRLICSYRSYEIEESIVCI